MTNIKQVSDWALTIAAEAAGSKLHHYERMADDNRLAQSIEAHARAIEQHEAFRQEVSDAVESRWMNILAMKCEDVFSRFIIAKPDPLVEAWLEAFPGNHITDAREECAKISAALAARGLEIREKQP